MTLVHRRTNEEKQAPPCDGCANFTRRTVWKEGITLVQTIGKPFGSRDRGAGTMIILEDASQRGQSVPNLEYCTMTRSLPKLWRRILCCLAALTCSSCSNGDSDRLSSIWHKAGAHLIAFTGGIRQRLSSGWESIQSRSGPESALRERVAARLRSDKVFAESAIEVEVQGTTVTLRGQAPDVAGRQRAVELAQGTLGVEQVTDELGPKE